MKDQRARKLFRNFLFTLVTLILFLALVEISLRVYLHFSHFYPLSQIMEQDEERGYRLKPDGSATIKVGRTYPPFWKYWKKSGYEITHSINSMGFRGKEIVAFENVPELRILCFGDSNTFGLDVEDDRTYSENLERMLTQAFPETHVEVINAGVPGYTVRQGLVYAYEIIPELRPQVVIIAFGANDYKSNLMRNWFPLREANDFEIMRGDIEKGFERIQMPLWKRAEACFFKSYIFTLFLGAYQHIFVTARFMESLDAVKEHNSAPGSLTKKNSLEKFENVRMPPRYYQNDLYEFCRLAVAYNAMPVLVIPWDVMFMEYRAANHATGGYASKIPVIDLYDKFEKLTDISYLESRPELRENLEFYKAMLGEDVIKENESLLVTSDGCHPNRIGHRIIADEIFSVMINILPEDLIQEKGQNR